MYGAYGKYLARQVSNALSVMLPNPFLGVYKVPVRTKTRIWMAETSATIVVPIASRDDRQRAGSMNSTFPSWSIPRTGKVTGDIFHWVVVKETALRASNAQALWNAEYSQTTRCRTPISLFTIQAFMDA